MPPKTPHQSGDADEDLADAYAEKDPNNRLLWRMNRRRLDLESMRDSMLAASGELDVNMGGNSVDLVKYPYSRRRTVYGFIERKNLASLFRTFDFANPDSSNARRFATTVPQQALYLMNGPFVIERAKRLASRDDVKRLGEGRLSSCSNSMSPGIVVLFVFIRVHSWFRI